MYNLGDPDIIEIYAGASEIHEISQTIQKIMTSNVSIAEMNIGKKFSSTQ